ncbi:MAG: 2,5-diamino-6-(ribosylamino)-4(3H)-pyrimidinone 5'-phosphate reductase [Thermoplasmata archaeon]|nr:2,5-diamino-6-(ribosylamino)-4(3H)-pyrimidinone 5'-phosphate reductase [Thermoplasmata archaeon]
MYIIVNCAISVDGKLALKTRRQTRISSDEDIARVHLLRSSVDAVLVGIGTVLADDPKLTVKEKYVPNPRQPIRVVLDSKGRTPENAQVLQGAAKTVIVTAEDCTKQIGSAVMLRCGRGRVDVVKAVGKLEKLGIKRMLVEGGGTVIWEFLNKKLVDEVNVYVGSIVIGGKGAPTMADGDGAGTMEEVVRLKFLGCERLGDGVLLRYSVEK